MLMSSSMSELQAALNAARERSVELSTSLEDEKNHSAFLEVSLENEKDKNDESVKTEKIVAHQLKGALDVVQVLKRFLQLLQRLYQFLYRFFMNMKQLTSSGINLIK